MKEKTADSENYTVVGIRRDTGDKLKKHSTDNGIIVRALVTKLVEDYLKGVQDGKEKE